MLGWMLIYKMTKFVESGVFASAGFGIWKTAAATGSLDCIFKTVQWFSGANPTYPLVVIMLNSTASAEKENTVKSD